MKTFFTFLILLIAAAPLHAQGPNGKICGIYFDYDAVGNRIKRSYDCRNMGEGTEDPPAAAAGAATAGVAGAKPRKAPPRDTGRSAADGSLDAAVLLFPNPTAGPFTLRLSAAPQTPLHFHWYNEALQILGSGSINAPEYKGDISAWPDGTYILRVYRADEVYTFKVVKATGATH